MRLINGEISKHLLDSQLLSMFKELRPSTREVVVIIIFNEIDCTSHVLKGIGFTKELAKVSTKVLDTLKNEQEYNYLIAITPDWEFARFLDNVDKIENEKLRNALIGYKIQLQELQDKKKKADDEVEISPKSHFNISLLIQFFLGIILFILACVAAAFVPVFTDQECQLFGIAALLLALGFLLIKRGGTFFTNQNKT